MQVKFHNIVFIFIAASILSIGAAGCGGSTATTPSVNAPVRPTPTMSVSIAANPSSSGRIDVGQTISLSASVSNDPAGKGVQWSIACSSGLNDCGGMAKNTSLSGAADKYVAPNAVWAGGSAAVTAKSISDPTKYAQFNINVYPMPSAINSGPVTGNVGQPFQLAVLNLIQGGVQPFACSLKSGTLPRGLSLDVSYQVSGIPLAVYNATVVFHCTDSGTPAVPLDVPAQITINPMIPLAIGPVSGTLPSGIVGVPYYRRWVCFWGWRWCHWTYGYSVSASGGVQPLALSWAGVSGSSTPPGLSFGCSGCTRSYIMGTPTTVGTYNFTVTVTDSESPPRSSSAQYTLTILPTPSPTPSTSPSPSPSPSSSP